MEENTEKANKNQNQELILENKDAEENSELELNKKKRRRKNVVDGRNFVCHCGKAYLSQPALNNHIKIKHSDKTNQDNDNSNNITIDRRRRKTKREISEFVSKKFFKTADRKIRNSKDDILTNSGYKALLEEIFSEIFLSGKYLFETKYSSFVQNNLMNVLLNKISKREAGSDINQSACLKLNSNNSSETNTKEREELKLNNTINTPSDENKDKVAKHSDGRVKRILRKIKKLRRIKKNTDTIIGEYIDFCRDNCNKKDLKTILLYVFLFREMVNKVKKDNYTFKKGPQKIVELANQFFPFLREIKFLEIISDDIVVKLVEAIIHFSYWLLEKSHTKVKLNLNVFTHNPANELNKKRRR